MIPSDAGRRTLHLCSLRLNRGDWAEYVQSQIIFEFLEAFPRRRGGLVSRDLKFKLGSTYQIFLFGAGLRVRKFFSSRNASEGAKVNPSR